MTGTQKEKEQQLQILSPQDGMSFFIKKMIFSNI
jgi:hypothetical protein